MQRGVAREPAHHTATPYGHTKIQHRTHQDSPPSLVILSGPPRSGTSWLGKLFDSHPRTLYRHEPDSIPPWPSFPFYIDKDYETHAASLVQFVRELPFCRTAKVSASLPGFPKTYLAPGIRQVVRASLYAVKALETFGLRLAVPRYCLPRAQQAYVVVWKTIASSGRLGFFAEVLQDKRIIHILRHPGAIVASQLRGIHFNKFDQNFKAYDDYDTFEDLLQSPAGQRSGLSMEALKQMTAVERLARSVLLNMENAVAAIEGRPDCKLLVYEELCARRFEVMEELLRFCDLPFAPQVRDFLTASGAKHRSRYYSVFKDPLAAASQWRRELSSADQALVRAQLDRTPLASLWPD